MSSNVLPVYRRSPYRFVRGEGVHLYDEEGQAYLDFAAGIAVNSLGHCHPHLVAALEKQANTLWHVSNLYQIPGLETLARRLCAATFADMAFFCSSGAEAVECGIKMVRRYHYVKEGKPEGQAKRYRIITVDGSFHGRTMATISAAGKPSVMEGFQPALPGFDQVPAGDIAAVEAAITEETAGILLEPIQGEGGVTVATPDYLQALRALCDQHGILLFLDEVQCGMGRTGALFFYEQAGIVPDILSSAKGIGSGFPLGACIATKEAASGMEPGTHGSTYGNNPLAMAVGNAVLDIILEEGFLAQVHEMGEYFGERLQALADSFPKVVREVRGVGLMRGLGLQVNARDFVARAREHRFLAVPAAQEVVRLLPPLIVKKADIDEAYSKLEAMCKEY